MSQVPKHRQLPDKESKLFKELLTQYELKQHKKGLKAAEAILKKFPNHGETLALKALTLQSSLPYPLTVSTAPKLEEAEAMARLAVKKDISSHITWHVLGIFAKSRKDWDEASRAFAMARKLDPDNIPLIRDSIALLTHTRQYAQAAAARHHHLNLRPQVRSAWLGLMVALDLTGEPKEALEVYDSLQGFMKTDGATSTERSQTVLFVVKTCMRSGQYDAALERLEQAFKKEWISPRGEATQLKAELLMELGRLAEAEDTYRACLEQNSDNLEFYRGFLRTKGYDITKPLESDATTKVLITLSSFSETFPKTSAPRRLALEVSSGDSFKQLVQSYLINGLERGVPSLFVDVKGLYRDQAKMSAVGEIMEDIVSRLEKALSLNDDVNHTPTLPELYMAKAMVLKRSGDALGAAQQMEEARLLDLQDRFLNGKATKYWFRAGNVAKAEELMAMFTKKDTPAVSDLTELQCLWFLLEEGGAHRANGNLALSLKRYHSVVNTFRDYEDDQYDFHTYCMRRMTLSAYVSLMTYEDQLRSHPAYFQSALSAIDIYLSIWDDPSLKEEHLTAEQEAERKKAAKKAQKAEQKAKKAALASADGKKEDPAVPDEDPLGQNLLKTETPLEDAVKLWRPLEKLASRRIETWTVGYDIFRRLNLPLAALRCLTHGIEIDAEDATVHRQIVHFYITFYEKRASFSAPIPTILESLPTLIPLYTDLASYNTTFLSRHSISAAHILACAHAQHLIDATAETEVVRIVNTLADDDVPPNITTMKSALAFLKDLNTRVSLEGMEAFRKRCQERVPLARDIDSEGEQQKRRAAMEAGTGEVDGVNGVNGH